MQYDFTACLLSDQSSQFFSSPYSDYSLVSIQKPLSRSMHGSCIVVILTHVAGGDARHMWILILTRDLIIFMQWAYGVTCWEIFSGGTVPYSEVLLRELPKMLVDGYRLDKPLNSACNEDL